MLPLNHFFASNTSVKNLKKYYNVKQFRFQKEHRKLLLSFFFGGGGEEEGGGRMGWVEVRCRYAMCYVEKFSQKTVSVFLFWAEDPRAIKKIKVLPSAGRLILSSSLIFCQSSLLIIFCLQLFPETL